MKGNSKKFTILLSILLSLILLSFIRNDLTEQSFISKINSDSEENSTNTLKISTINWTMTTEVISTESTNNSNWPAIVSDSVRNIHVVWEDLTNYASSGTDRDIFYKLKNATTGAWVTIEVVSTESTNNSYLPAIVTDQIGNIHVVWQDDTNYNGSGIDLDIFYKLRNASSGIWTTTEVVSTESTGISGEPTISLDFTGNIHVAWKDYTNYDSSGTDMDIFYKLRNATTDAWTITEVS